MTNIPKYTILLFLLLFLLSCKDKENPVPDVYVNITIDLNDASYNDLVPGSYKNITGGLSGIILYRKNFNEFSAIERTCPYEAEYNTRVTVIPDNTLFMECDSCKSRFYIEDGSLIEGPSKFPLNQYKTMFDGRYLRIYN
ncbi:MAG: hypothetical protein R6U85_01970 [Salinivirgaceae bacterium]